MKMESIFRAISFIKIYFLRYNLDIINVQHENHEIWHVILKVNIGKDEKSEWQAQERCQ